MLLAAGGTWLGFPILGPIIRLLIGVAILLITRDATIRIWYRLMDAVGPALVGQIEHKVGACSRGKTGYAPAGSLGRPLTFCRAGYCGKHGFVTR